jgi:fatty-acyl-CoA synthase
VNESTMIARRKALEDKYSPWRARTTAQLFDLVAACNPDRPFVLGDAAPITYADMRDQSLQLAAGLLAIGIRPGDRVAMDMANFADFIALKLATARIGAVSVAINFLLRRDELAYLLEQSGASVLITMDQFRGLDYLECLDSIAPGWEHGVNTDRLSRLRHVFVRPVDKPTPDRGAPLSCLAQAGAALPRALIDELTQRVDPASVSDVIYTSGTTGRPKGVMLVHDSVVRMAYGSAYARAFQDGRRIASALPMYHVFGYIEAMLAAVVVAGAVVPFATFEPAEMLQAVARHQVDELIAVPAMTTRLLDEAETGRYDLSRLSAVFSSGAPHAPQMWQRMVDVFGVDELFTAYGQTETTASTMCTLPGDPLSRLQTTNGTTKPAGVAGDPALGGGLAVYKVVAPDTGEELAAGQIGEFVARGPAISPGYFDKPAETAQAFTADGWLRTGDLGRIDHDGYLVLTGRIKESYRIGGELVLPAEVEEVLGRHPAVKAAHVVGVPHPRMGEVGWAFIVAAQGAVVDEAEVLAYCAQFLARFKVPARVLVIDESQLPTTVTGRVQKFRLVERATATLGNAAGARADTMELT